MLKVAVFLGYPLSQYMTVDTFAEITPKIVVYRFSLPKLVEYLRAKVVRLATTEVIECSRTLVRNLAKDGLMEDGKDELLECTSLFCHGRSERLRFI